MKYVAIIDSDNELSEDTGILRFTKEFSEKYEYSLPNYFLLNKTNFKASHVKKLEVL